MSHEKGQSPVEEEAVVERADVEGAVGDALVLQERHSVWAEGEVAVPQVMSVECTTTYRSPVFAGLAEECKYPFQRCD